MWVLLGRRSVHQPFKHMDQDKEDRDRDRDNKDMDQDPVKCHPLLILYIQVNALVRLLRIDNQHLRYNKLEVLSVGRGRQILLRVFLKVL